MDAATLKERLDRAIAQIRSLEDNTEINRIVEAIVVELTGAEYASVWINDFPRLLRMRESGVREISLEEKRGLLYRCYITQQSAIYNYITSEKGYVQAIDNPDNIRIKSKMTIPLLYEERLVGIVTCYSSVRKIKNFTPRDLERFASIAPFVIDAICKMLTNMGRPPLKTQARETEGCLEEDGSLVAASFGQIQAAQSQTSDREALLKSVAQIVHDIRTPASNLTGFLEILEEHIHDERLREYLGYAKSSAQLINTLTTSILETVAAQREVSPDEGRRPVEPRLFFSEIAHIFSANMFEKRIAYNIYIDPALPDEMTVDGMKLRRVVMNLLGNALKFTPEGGRVDFDVIREETGGVTVAVSDSGIGIPPERQREIFKPFVQADASTKEAYGGTGLGLAICAEYVRQMGGELRLESEVDRGSRFDFTLPQAAGTAVKERTEESPGRVSVALLAGGDDRGAVETLQRYMRRLGLAERDVTLVKEGETLPSGASHLILFQSRLEEGVLKEAKQNTMEVMVMEEKFLSMNPEEHRERVLASRYEYYGRKLEGFLRRKRAVRVLIVEDDPISVELLTAMLKEEFCTVEIARDGLEGFAKLKNALMEGEPYDVVYTDMHMPGLTGAQMLSEYRELEQEFGADPIRAVSISGDPEVQQKSELFDRFAVKPFRKAQIKEMLAPQKGVAYA